jgi:hypothetical protein
MPSIIRLRDTFHGISIAGRGVFTDNLNGSVTYAGQYKDGHACGLGVATYSDGYKVYAEHGPDGECDGRWFGRSVNGDTVYVLFERGKCKEYAHVFADGRYCEYNTGGCARNDPRLLALIAQVAPVEVRPAAAAPATRHSPGTRPEAIVRWMSRLVVSPQALAAAVATEVHPHAARHSLARRCTERCHSLRGFSSPCTRRMPRSFPSRSRLGRALQFCHRFRVWQAEEAVANLPLRMQRATDTMQDAQDFMQHTLWQHAFCSVRNSKQQIACSMQQATCSTQQPSRRE